MSFSCHSICSLFTNMTKTYTIAALFGTVYAIVLSSDEGKEWIDEYTTVGVVLGVAGVLLALRAGQPRDEWRMTAGAFAAAGAPLVVRGLVRRFLS